MLPGVRTLMPLSLAKVRASTALARFEYLGETVHLVVRSSAMTPAFFADLAALSSIQSDASGTALLNDPAELERIGVLVCRIIAEWDLLGEDGETPYPLTPEALVELPFDFLSAALS